MTVVIDPRSMNTIELKAAAFDLICQIERDKRSLAAVQSEIARRQEQEDKKNDAVSSEEEAGD